MAHLFNQPRPSSSAWLRPISRHTSETEWTVMGWFAAGHEILWIPIYEIRDESAAAIHQESLEEPRLIRTVLELGQVPLGLKGWLFPAHLDDTDVVCERNAAGEWTFGVLVHPRTRQRITSLTSTEGRDQAPSQRQV